MSLSRQLKQRRRLVLDLEKRGVAGIPLLGRYNYTNAHPALPDHLHGGALEICYLVRGVQTYRVGNRYFRMRGGELFLTFPNERHGTGGLPEERGELYWMIVRIPPRREGLLGLPAPQSRALLKALLGIKQRHFRASPEIKDRLDALVSLFCEKPGPLNAFALANHVGGFLHEVVKSATQSPRPAGCSSLAPVLARIRKAPQESWPVSRLARLADLSASRFKARFKEETGIPPAEFVLRVRIEAAQQRLDQGGQSVTDIAYDLGFSSSQYFATVFKRFTGVSPSGYLNKGLSDSPCG